MFNLDSFITDCRAALKETSPELAIRELVERAGGREDNTFYRRSAQGLVVSGNKQLETTDVAVLWKTVIHGVANPLRQFTGAIHIYGGDFFGTPRSEWDPETLEERPYDVDRAKRVFAEANERGAAESAGG